MMQEAVKNHSQIAHDLELLCRDVDLTQVSRTLNALVDITLGREGGISAAAADGHGGGMMQWEEGGREQDRQQEGGGGGGAGMMPQMPPSVDQFMMNQDENMVEEDILGEDN